MSSSSPYSSSHPRGSPIVSSAAETGAGSPASTPTWCSPRIFTASGSLDEGDGPHRGSVPAGDLDGEGRQHEAASRQPAEPDEVLDERDAGTERHLVVRPGLRLVDGEVEPDGGRAGPDDRLRRLGREERVLAVQPRRPHVLVGPPAVEDDDPPGELGRVEAAGVEI